MKGVRVVFWLDAKTGRWVARATNLEGVQVTAGSLEKAYNAIRKKVEAHRAASAASAEV